MSYTPMSDLGQQGLFDITRTLLQQPDLPSLSDAPRDKCAHFREINGIAAAFQHLQKNYNPIASSFL